MGPTRAKQAEESVDPEEEWNEIHVEGEEYPWTGMDMDEAEETPPGLTRERKDPGGDAGGRDLRFRGGVGCTRPCMVSEAGSWAGQTSLA